MQDELSLLSRARALDEEALAEIHDTYYGPIFRYVIYRVGERTVAEDLTSDVFLRLLSALRDRSAPQKTLRGWLYSVASHVVNDYHRKRYRMEQVKLEDTLPNPAAGPAERLATKLRWQEVQSALATLTEEQREVVALRFGQELPIREVARLLGKSEGAVKQLQAERREEIHALLATGQEGTVACAGTIEALSEESWTLDGLAVAIEARTVISGEPALGATAQGLCRVANGRVVAETLQVEDSPVILPEPTPTATEMPTTTLTSTATATTPTITMTPIALPSATLAPPSAPATEESDEVDESDGQEEEQEDEVETEEDEDADNQDDVGDEEETSNDDDADDGDDDDGDDGHDSGDDHGGDDDMDDDDDGSRAEESADDDED